MATRRNMKAHRVGMYARVSTTDKGQDPEVQLLALRQVAEQRGWLVVDEYVDAGISGSKGSRPALDRLMTDARAGRIDVVAVARFDRFARSTRHLLSALEEFRLLNVDFLSLSESVDTSTPIGRMVFTVVAAVAELEQEILRERVHAGLRRAREQGKHLGRPKVELDLRPALAMFRQGHGLKATARALGVSKSTLRRRLREAGEWPRPERGPEPQRRGGRENGVHNGVRSGVRRGMVVDPDVS